MPTHTRSNTTYAEGYQAAMQDILEALETGGENAARTWITANAIGN